MERSAIVRLIGALRDATEASADDSRAVRWARQARASIAALTPHQRVACGVLVTVVGVGGFAIAAGRLPPHQQPSLPLAAGVLLALIAAALASPFRQ